jgi:hypothetical protein
MRRLLVAAVMVVASVSLSGCTSARQRCIDAVTKEYMAADKVLQQPADLDGFCAAWNNHPPGIGSSP